MTTDIDVELIWSERLSAGRRKPADKDAESDTEIRKVKTFESRTQHERDFDRILFSTPVRRLADKTQVFPLDKNDSVRNRLTHSYEVSNLARSLGVALVYSEFSSLSKITDSQRNVPAILAAIGLVHDLGNPPFGHQGEAAIQSWFNERKSQILLTGSRDVQYFKDFELFEGNAQAFRLVTKLQILSDSYGLNLTHATLAAMMKYPVRSLDVDKNNVFSKKHGFFYSEEDIADSVLNATGLSFGRRHALAYLMEACDDIAYVALDAEDTIKKGLASFSDLISHLQHFGNGDEVIEKVVDESKRVHKKYRESLGLSPAELNDLSMQIFRVNAIGAMINAAKTAFEEHEVSLVSGTQKKSLLALSIAEKLRAALKEFSFRHGYTHKSVLALELEGYNTIRGLMDMFWFAIDSMAGKSFDEKKNAHPFARFVYSRISENYRRVSDNEFCSDKLPVWYIKSQLLTDMISGMTDSYAISLYQELLALRGNCEFGKGL